jgi:hypothetical protein
MIGFNAEDGELSDGMRFVQVNSDAVVSGLLREGVLKNSERQKKAKEFDIFHYWD